MAKKNEIQEVSNELRLVGERAARVKILEESISAMEERIKAERKMLYAEMVDKNVFSFRLDDGSLVTRTKQGEDKEVITYDMDAISQVLDLEPYTKRGTKPGVTGHIRIRYSDEAKAMNAELKAVLDQEIANFYRQLAGE